MLRFFSIGPKQTDIHLVNGKCNKEEFERLKSAKPDYGSLTKTFIKIKPFSLCSSPSSSFQKKRENLNNHHVNESEPPLKLKA